MRFALFSSCFCWFKNFSQNNCWLLRWPKELKLLTTPQNVCNLKVNSIKEDVKLLEQAIVDHSVVPKGSIPEKELLIRLSSIEEELDALDSQVKKDMDKLMILIESKKRAKNDPEDD